MTPGLRLLCIGVLVLCAWGVISALKAGVARQGGVIAWSRDRQPVWYWTSVGAGVMAVAVSLIALVLDGFGFQPN